jgi:hypothetical protein
MTDCTPTFQTATMPERGTPVEIKDRARVKRYNRGQAPPRGVVAEVDPEGTHGIVLGEDGEEHFVWASQVTPATR